MRLIDADKLPYVNKVILVDKSDGDIKITIAKEYTSYVNDETPTVKAIPIEWLHSIMKKQLIFAMESEMEGTTTVKDGVIHCVSGALACQVLANVIELWEKHESRDTESIK